MLIEFIVRSLRMVAIVETIEVGFVEEILLDLVQLEEEHLVTGYHQNDEKEKQKSWHDQHIKNKQFHIGYLILQYGSKFLKQPGKIRTYQLGPYIVIHIIEGGVVKLKKLNGTPFKGLFILFSSTQSSKRVEKNDEKCEKRKDKINKKKKKTKIHKFMSVFYEN